MPPRASEQSSSDRTPRVSKGIPDFVAPAKFVHELPMPPRASEQSSSDRTPRVSKGIADSSRQPTLSTNSRWQDPTAAHSPQLRMPPRANDTRARSPSGNP